METTFTTEEMKDLLKQVMNLGMSHRQDQISGDSDKSGNEVLEGFIKNLLNSKLDKERLVK